MRSRLLFFLVLGIGLAPASLGGPFDQVLRQVGLDEASAKFDLETMYKFGPGAFRLAYFDSYMNEPLSTPQRTDELKAQLEALGPDPDRFITFASEKLGFSVGQTASHDAGTAPPPLAEAIFGIVKLGGGSLTEEEKQMIAGATGRLPVDLQHTASRLLSSAVPQAVRDRDTAFEPLKERFPKAQDAVKAIEDYQESGAVTPEAEAVMGGSGFESLYRGTARLVGATWQAANDLGASRIGQEDFDFDCDTPLGRISLHGSGADSYPAGTRYLLIIDTGGNDAYEAGAAADSECPVSIVIDLAGDDSYASPIEKEPIAGSGFFGYGICFDMSGNDRYSGRTLSMGAAAFGAGLLYDASGDDTYDGYTDSAGSAQFGIGLLVDQAGNDRYTCYQTSQGFGYTRGLGLLYDAAGDDRYVANDTDIKFPSPQTAEHNASLSQGSGFGRRADTTEDKRFLAGGIGILWDAAGDDTYSAGLFAQGAGYWYGLGILLDAAGDDSYSSVWYDQGAAAHFAIGVLRDLAGRDKYRATHNMAQGAGHDFSIGFLIDDSGNDRYDAPNLSLGGGNDNGMGFFWDKAGDDIYSVEAATALGRANITAGRGGPRDKLLCLGAFLDTGGDDTYSKPFAKDDLAWTQAGTNTDEPLATEKGAGVDTEAGGR